MSTDPKTDPLRIPIAHSVRYAARGLPEVPNQYGPGTLAPSEITLTYRAAPDSGLGRVHAYVAGRIWVGGAELPLLPGGLYGQHYDDGLAGWPGWLAEEARLHDPDAPTTDRPRALHLLEAAEFLRDAHFRDGLSVQEIGAALRHMADEADPMVGSLARDGVGLDEIAAMPASVPPVDRAALSAKLWEIAEHHIVAEWICCEPLEPKHTLCVKGYAALGMARSLLVDADPEEAWNPNAPLLDAVLAELAAGERDEQQAQQDQRPHGCDTSTCPCLACEDDEEQQLGTEVLPSIHANDVQGFCPACGHGVLMLGEGGHVVCTLMDCPKPEAVDELLHATAAAPVAGQPPADTGEEAREEIECANCWRVVENRSTPNMGGPSHDNWVHIPGGFQPCFPQRGADSPRAEPDRAAPAVPETVHGCPPDGSGLTPCCGRTPFELPLTDRISSEVPVTCKGADRG